MMKASKSCASSTNAWTFRRNLLEISKAIMQTQKGQLLNEDVNELLGEEDNSTNIGGCYL